MTNVNIINSYKGTTGSLAGGPTGIGSFLLQSGGIDFIIRENQSIKQSNGDNINLSLGTCTNELLLSGGTDNILLSGGTDKVLITGYCSNFIVLSQRRLMRTG